MSLGKYLRKSRERLRASEGREYSLRQVAVRANIKPAYLSNIETDRSPAPSERVIRDLAEILDIPAAEALAAAGRVPQIVKSAFEKNPLLMTEVAKIIASDGEGKSITLDDVINKYADLNSRPFWSDIGAEIPLDPKAWGQDETRRLLVGRGFAVRENESVPNSTSLIAEKAKVSCKVWPKTSWKVRQVRLGSSKSLSQKERSDFVFAFFPTNGSETISDGYDLFIIRGDIASEDGHTVHDAWLAKPTRDGNERKGSAGVMVKDIKREPHRTIWEKWNKSFLDGWEWMA